VAPVQRSASLDGVSVAYDREGAGPAVVLLHGWPGDRGDWRAVRALLRADHDLIVPDLRGFGESDRPQGDPAQLYSAAAQARSILALLDELGTGSAVLAGYDVGSRVAQRVARDAPERVRALVVSPPLPGVGRRVLEPEAQREYWYQSFHRLELPEELIDGRVDAVRAYLTHFWSHWSGPGFSPAAEDLERLVGHYAPPGAFLSSIAWYRAGAGTVATSLAEEAPEPGDRLTMPTTVLWPTHDPLFPPSWGDRLDAYFTDITVQRLEGVGHFTPLEAPEAFAAAIRAAAADP
jgi:pimeloyl-ACP methyl ester carboxylesterase